MRRLQPRSNPARSLVPERSGSPLGLSAIPNVQAAQPGVEVVDQLRPRNRVNFASQVGIELGLQFRDTRDGRGPRRPFRLALVADT
jgi:hypothetical protein